MNAIIFIENQMQVCKESLRENRIVDRIDFFSQFY